MVRFGIGQYVTPEIEAAEARDYFLAAVQRVAPEVLESLRDGPPRRRYRMLRLEWELCREPEGWQAVTARYRERYGDRAMLAVTGHRLPREWAPFRQADEADGFYPDLLPLKAALLAWGERFHLTDDWLMDAALDALAEWEEWPQVAEHLEWGCGGWSSLVPIADDDRRLRFEHPGYDPFGFACPGETRGQAKARILRDFESFLDDHLDRMEALARERGGRLAPVKRNRSGSPVLHFDWLARYQCLERSPYEIAHEDLGDPALAKTVLSAVEATAALIGLTPRKQHPGRPRKPAE